MRPARLIAVVGTGTDVGKTWVSRTLLSKWKASGLKVAARKPVQSFDEEAGATDAELLGAATGEDARAVCPAHRWYSRAMAPPMAASELGKPRIIMSVLVAEVAWPQNVDIGLVETAGGVCSPMAHDGDCKDFVRRLEPDEMLLIANAGLGTINAVKLSMQHVEPKRTRVFLNRFDETNRVHLLNAEWLVREEGLAVLTRIEDLL